MGENAPNSKKNFANQFRHIVLVLRAEKNFWCHRHFKDHCLRFIGNQFVNGLPSHPFDKRSAWGIKTAICYYPSSTVLKFLQLINFRQTGAATNRTAVSKVGLHNTREERLQSFFREKRLGMS